MFIFIFGDIKDKKVMLHIRDYKNTILKEVNLQFS